MLFSRNDLTRMVKQGEKASMTKYFKFFFLAFHPPQRVGVWLSKKFFVEQELGGHKDEMKKVRKSIPRIASSLEWLKM